MANKFVYCVCFALAMSHFTLPFDVCQPEAFWFMKRAGSSVSVVPREIEDSLCNIFSVPVQCRGRGRGRWGGVGEVLHV